MINKKACKCKKKIVLMIVKVMDDDKYKYFKGCDPKHKDELVNIISN
jgi:hypothetical protein